VFASLEVASHLPYTLKGVTGALLYAHARDANTRSPSAVAILHFAQWTL
jgi:hypothetical protein